MKLSTFLFFICNDLFWNVREGKEIYLVKKASINIDRPNIKQKRSFLLNFSWIKPQENIIWYLYQGGNY